MPGTTRCISRQTCLFLLIAIFSARVLSSSSNSCYDDTGPIACFPPFVNPAFNRLFTVSNTCGQKQKEHFCLQMVIGGEEKWCDDCDATDESKAHPPKYLTDHNTPQNLTWWQSSTMLVEDIQYPNSVNLTLGLGKTFEITYIRLKFRSSRPESFAIYKKVSVDRDWLPFQYYSSTCEATYGISTSRPITDDEATCRDDFSDISPLTDGTVAFSSLENRPSAYHYKDSPELHDWVAAKYIMISLDRLNTFRDEVFGDPLSLSTYFYAISDISMGGRCKCNGHAKECVITGDELQCVCEHNTGGVDCEVCLPFFNDQPWRRSFVGQSFECKACNCNGRSETCEFDPQLYHSTGHGGRCTNCRENFGGPNCDVCKRGYYEHPGTKKCVDCGCRMPGSVSPDCDQRGRCTCLPGVTGDRCDQCLPYHFNLSSDGCTKCNCHPAGIMPGTQNLCDPVSGHCHCKIHVGGRDCDHCVEGHYGLSEDNPLGCTACFCHGHSRECSAADGYMVNEIKSTFRTGEEGWKGTTPSNDVIDVEHLDVTKEISLVSNDDQTLYFLAPRKFLGDLRHSHNLRLSFDLRIEGGHGDPILSVEDVVLQAGDGRKLSVPVFIQGNKVPGREKHHYSYVIGEHEVYGWSPSNYHNVELGRFLSNITALKIRANYVPQGIAFLSNVTLETASRSPGVREATVETCSCPDEYMGQFCESCLPGYKRYPQNSGPFGTCVPCQCNGHSDSCEMESGRCICQHNTVGLFCERCADGYFGNALNGTEDDCQPCLCPNGGRCTQLQYGGEIVCLDCEEGYGGLKCDECLDDYYRDVSGRCVACDCNNNTDPNAVGTCDRVTGECSKCLYNTTGNYCQNCFKGFYGEPTKEPHGECFHCECNDYGSVLLEEEGDVGTTWEESSYGGRGHSCNPYDGQCRCKTNVEGRKCDKCADGTWGLYSAKGCEDCNCDPVGSFNTSCDIYSGQCHCRPGVTGLKCDKCLAHHYGFSYDGCKECRCNYYGSTGDDCDLITGACTCREKYVGRQCDQCQLNYYNLAVGCEECPICYQLLLEPYHEIRKKISDMRITVEQAANLPPSIAEDDQEFRSQVDKLLRDIKATSDRLEEDETFEDTRWIKNMTDSIDKLNKKFEKIVAEVTETDHKMRNISNQLRTGDDLVEGAREELERAWARMNDSGEALITRLKEEQRKSGDQSDQLTKMAQESRDYHDRLDQQIKDIRNLTTEAEKTSREAMDVAGSFRGEQAQLDHELKAVTQLKDHLKQLHEKTVNNSAESHVKATEALEEAEKVLAEVEEISVDDVDLDETNTSQLFQGIDDLRQQLAEHSQAEADLLSDFQFGLFDQRVFEAKNSAGERKGLMERAESSLNESLAAQGRAEEVLKEAQKIQADLQSFDDKIRVSKEESEDAKVLVADVQSNLQNAENYTNLASFQLDVEGAHRNAEDSNRISLIAMVQAFNRTEELTEMEKEVEETQESRDRLREAKDEEMKSVEKLEKRMEKLDLQVQEDEKNLDELLENLNSTTYSLAEQKNHLSTSSLRIEQLILLLQDLTLSEDTSLQNIEDRLDASETTLVESEINEKYSKMENALINLRGLVGNFEQYLDYLKREVQEIGAISDSIPESCKREITLEPGF